MNIKQFKEYKKLRNYCNRSGSEPDSIESIFEYMKNFIDNKLSENEEDMNTLLLLEADHKRILKRQIKNLDTIENIDRAKNVLLDRLMTFLTDSLKPPGYRDDFDDEFKILWGNREKISCEIGFDRVVMCKSFFDLFINDQYWNQKIKIQKFIINSDGSRGDPILEDYTDESLNGLRIKEEEIKGEDEAWLSIKTFDECGDEVCDIFIEIDERRREVIFKLEGELEQLCALANIVTNWVIRSNDHIDHPMLYCKLSFPFSPLQQVDYKPYEEDEGYKIFGLKIKN